MHHSWTVLGHCVSNKLYSIFSLFFLFLFTFSSSASLQLWREMESSDDDTLSERSCASEPSFRSERSGGSLSPCPSGLVGLPGDTLPWNLSKHERRKRKSQNSVLDPAERAVVRVAGEEINLCFRSPASSFPLGDPQLLVWSDGWRKVLRPSDPCLLSDLCVSSSLAFGTGTFVTVLSLNGENCSLL